MAQSPTVPVGAVIPTQISWQIYFGTNQLQQKLGWVMPSPGTYTVETSADLVTWSAHSTLNPRSSGAEYWEPIEPSAPVTAYRMTKTA